MNKRKIHDIFKELNKKYPNPKTELQYINHYTLLISIVLSAQATDIAVNRVTKKLFKLIKTPQAMIKFGENKLKKYIKSIGLFNTKAKNIIILSNILVKKYNNKVPKEFHALISLPGVGNKTASVFQNVALKLPRIAVDTHVYRVANRLGMANAKTSDLTQKHLEKTVPKKWLMIAHHLLILHGRYICKSQTPLCKKCSVSGFCEYARKSN